MTLPNIFQNLRSLSANVREEPSDNHNNLNSDIFSTLFDQRRSIKKLLKITDQILGCNQQIKQEFEQKQKLPAQKKFALSTLGSTDSIETTDTTNQSQKDSDISNKSTNTKRKVNLRLDLSKVTPNSGLPPIYKYKSQEMSHLANNRVDGEISAQASATNTSVRKFKINKQKTRENNNNRSQSCADCNNYSDSKQSSFISGSLQQSQ
eukprot:403334373